jgi:hypothetical protein
VTCSRIALGIRRRRRRSHRIARRRAAEEQADTLSVGEGRQSRRLPGGDPQRAGASNQNEENASAGFTSVRRRAIPDARRSLSALLLRAIPSTGADGLLLNLLRGLPNDDDLISCLECGHGGVVEAAQSLVADYRNHPFSLNLTR